jgi:hypothetical protein
VGLTFERQPRCSDCVAHPLAESIDREAANEKQAIEAAINNTSGTLTVSDSIHTANVTLLGQYVTANFTKASDGHGGTLIGDPPLAITDTGPSAYTAAYTT